LGTWLADGALLMVMLTESHRIVAKSDPYLSDPSLVSALQTYSKHLDSLERGLSSDVKAAESELQEYADAGKGMEQIANRFAEVTRECEKVKAEIKRLEK
jgi:septation ring formation regulator EzrA